MKRSTLISLLIITTAVAALSWGSLIGTSKMFAFHDVTQAARVQDFTVNLLAGNIPPRIAPDFSFHMGYPVFNFYAPTAYWITALINIAGFSVAGAMKLSFFLGLLLAAIGMFLLLRLYVSEKASLTAAILFITSPLFPLEIFVRGNLAELWFLAFLPFTLFLMTFQDRNMDKWSFILLAISSLFLFTAHNALSLVALMVCALFLLMQKHKISVGSALILGILGGAYFVLPAIFELPLTYAHEVAQMTQYRDHFVCIRQLWSSPWGFGGSVPGCADGMSFMLGKAVVAFASLGIINLAWGFRERKRPLQLNTFLFFAIMGIVSTFLVTQYSAFLWEPLKVFQFPWRFLTFSVFGLSFASAYIFHILDTKKFGKYLLAVIVIVLLIKGKQYFISNPEGQLDAKVYDKTFSSQEYREQKAAFRIPEYLPKTANYKAWRSLENSNFDIRNVLSPLDNGSVNTLQQGLFTREAQTSSKIFLINIHYFPNWKIFINNKLYVPEKFDQLGRPLVRSKSPVTTVLVQYSQTQVQAAGNLISFTSLAVLLLTISSPLWHKMQRLSAKA